MSSARLIDPTTGLKLLEVSALPNGVLRHPFFSSKARVSSQRLYHFSLSCALETLGNDEPSISVMAILVFYDEVIGLAEGGKGWCIPLADLTLKICSDWLLLQGDSVSALGRWLLSDLNSFRETITRLGEHHGYVFQLEEFNLLDCLLADSAHLEPLRRMLSPSISWSTLHSAQGFVSDRMKAVKDEFSRLESERQSTLQGLVQQSSDLLNEIRESCSRLRHDTEDKLKEIDDLEDHSRALNAVEQRISAFRMEAIEVQEQLGSTTLRLSMERQEWKQILDERQTEEVAAKRQLVRLERTLESTAENCDAFLEAEVRKLTVLKEEASGYFSAEYERARSELDAITNLVRAEEVKLEETRAPDRTFDRQQVTRAVQTVLKETEAHRRVLTATVEELECERNTVKTLKSDVLTFESEVASLQDLELLVSAKRDNLLHHRMNLMKQISALRAENGKMQELLRADAMDDRPSYLVARSKLLESIQRRKDMENAILQQERERASRRAELQQRLFEIRIRVPCTSD